MLNKDEYIVICVMGKSGSGKSYFIEKAIDRNLEKFHYVTSNTTRAERKEDPRDKETHIFLTEEQYKKDLVDNKILALYTAPSGYHSYTTLDNFSKNKINIYAIDPLAFIDFHKKFKNSIGIYIKIDEDIRQSRLQEREPNKKYDSEIHLDESILIESKEISNNDYVILDNLDIEKMLIEFDKIVNIINLR